MSNVADIVKKAKEYKFYSNTYLVVHNYKAKQQQSSNTIFGIGVITLTSLIGLSQLKEILTNNDFRNGKYIVLVLAALAAITSALQHFLRFSDAAQQYKKASAEFGTLYNKFSIFELKYSPLIDVSETDRNKIITEFDNIMKDYQNAKKNAPTISNTLFEKYRNKLERG